MIRSFFYKVLGKYTNIAWFIVCVVSIDDLLEDSDDDDSGSDDGDDEGKRRPKKQTKVWIKEGEEILDFSHPSAAQNITGMEQFIYLCMYLLVCLFVDLFISRHMIYLIGIVMQCHRVCY